MYIIFFFYFLYLPEIFPSCFLILTFFFFLLFFSPSPVFLVFCLILFIVLSHNNCYICLHIPFNKSNYYRTEVVSFFILSFFLHSSFCISFIFDYFDTCALFTSGYFFVSASFIFFFLLTFDFIFLCAFFIFFFPQTIYLLFTSFPSSSTYFPFFFFSFFFAFNSFSFLFLLILFVSFFSSLCLYLFLLLFISF